MFAPISSVIERGTITKKQITKKVVELFEKFKANDSALSRR